MKLPLSNRLLACCQFVRPGDRVADIGCDHGYLGIHLIKSGIASSVIASDVKEGPLQSAVMNARKFGVREQISFYLSDGVRKLPRDFNCMVCAGMGADTMISILESAPWLKDARYRLVLQCQSKRPELRKYLASQGFAISRETLARDGRFIYPVMEVSFAPGSVPAPWDYYITPQLLEDDSPLLPEFLERVTGGLEECVKGLSREGGEKYEAMAEILRHLQTLKGANP
ncbi:MAG: class I SAM-dependent methyltransferase [Faecousia sp.]